MNAGRSHRTQGQRTAILSGPRRALLLVLYLAISIGTPLGHSFLLSIHVARDHSSLSSLNDWFAERAWSTMRLAEDARRDHEARRAIDDHDRLHAADLPHEHPPAESRAVAREDSDPGQASAMAGLDARQRRHDPVPADTPSRDAAPREATHSHAEPSRDRTLAPGEHEHGDLVHSHDPEPATDLASLTSHNSDHYLAPPQVALAPSILILANAAWPNPALADIAAAVLTPPPRSLV